eukprot:scaffold494638_cov46-Prasinocladus_malaysianus.AAC.1
MQLALGFSQLFMGVLSLLSGRSLQPPTTSHGGLPPELWPPQSPSHPAWPPLKPAWRPPLGAPTHPKPGQIQTDARPSQVVASLECVVASQADLAPELSSQALSARHAAAGAYHGRDAKVARHRPSQRR